MIVFERKIQKQIENLLFKGKAVLIFGPRQAGKTTLAKKLIAVHGEDGVYFNCELASVRNLFVLGEPEKLKQLIGNKKIVVFDEAQTIVNIGAILKTFLDTYKGVQIIATGSSSFDLANKINEPLTGRAFEFTLYPLSVEEIIKDKQLPRQAFLELLKTGSYPEVVREEEEYAKQSILKNIATNYLYKDVFMFESIKNPLVFENLIKMLAFQIGQLVSVNELSLSLGVSRATVEKYLKLLEQSYIIKRINAFSKNGRNELKKAFKIYFIDLGIRNAVIDSLAPVDERGDKGNLFENFVFLELLKSGVNEAFPPQIFFWRTDTKLEIDFILYKDEEIHAIETKWKKTVLSFKKFLELYPQANTEVVTTDDFIVFEDLLEDATSL
jgi:predicted AAA+ superfamily ATPase